MCKLEVDCWSSSWGGLWNQVDRILTWFGTNVWMHRDISTECMHCEIVRDIYNPEYKSRAASSDITRSTAASTDSNILSCPPLLPSPSLPLDRTLMIAAIMVYFQIQVTQRCPKPNERDCGGHCLMSFFFPPFTTTKLISIETRKQETTVRTVKEMSHWVSQHKAGKGILLRLQTEGAAHSALSPRAQWSLWGVLWGVVLCCMEEYYFFPCSARSLWTPVSTWLPCTPNSGRSMACLTYRHLWQQSCWQFQCCQREEPNWRVLQTHWGWCYGEKLPSETRYIPDLCFGWRDPLEEQQEEGDRVIAKPIATLCPANQLPGPKLLGEWSSRAAGLMVPTNTAGNRSQAPRSSHAPHFPLWIPRCLLITVTFGTAEAPSPWSWRRHQVLSSSPQARWPTGAAWGPGTPPPPPLCLPASSSRLLNFACFPAAHVRAASSSAWLAASLQVHEKWCSDGAERSWKAFK